MSIRLRVTEKVALKKIGEFLKQFFAVRNLEEAEVYFSGLVPTSSTIQHHHFLVNKIVSTAVESKDEDAYLKLVSQFFDVAADDKVSNGVFP